MVTSYITILQYWNWHRYNPQNLFESHHFTCTNCFGMCMLLCNLITCVDSCNCLHSTINIQNICLPLSPICLATSSTTLFFSHLKFHPSANPVAQVFKIYLEFYSFLSYYYYHFVLRHSIFVGFCDDFLLMHFSVFKTQQLNILLLNMSSFYHSTV